ncbi:MAG: 2-iminoacetate synthase ThiH [Deltaproteobacteria bacterium]|nr:2-iminoacetate synthase ThiH [Deltaproteobacteria bacterium]
MGYKNYFQSLDWETVKNQIKDKKAPDVKEALKNAGQGNLNDLMALLSPAAELFLEEMAQISHQLTKKRFGKTIQMYIPLYLSNECVNSCLYCGFRKENGGKRITLSIEEVLNEVEIIKRAGFDHLLLVTGEHPGKAGVDYLSAVIKAIRALFSHISIEVQPLETTQYEELIRLGLNTVLVYQETYNRDQYKQFHPQGKKSDFDFRLDTPDRLGKASIYKIGLGCLLGLEDWRTDSWFVGSHLRFLEKRYWKTKFSISFPRLRPAMGSLEPEYPLNDRELLQVILAYRIFNENVELSLSTRESRQFRDHVIKLGITTLSAGSKTEPGGYALNQDRLKQFEVHDERSSIEVARMIQAQGYESVWKDWEAYYGI